MSGTIQSGTATARFFKHEPSLALCRLYRLFWVGFYVLLFLFKDALPEKFGRDAITLAAMIESNSYDAGSYGAMAAIYAQVPAPILPFVPALVCIPSLWIILRYVRSYPVMLLMPILLFPYMIMNFLYPSKETLVGLIILIFYRISQAKMPTWQAIFLFVLIYGLYALFVRQYYAVILLFFIIIMLAKHAPPVFTAAGLVIGLGIMLFLPSEFYEAVQGPRDEAALHMSLLAREVRTFFFNPMPPHDVFAFFVNMAWGLLVMFFPFLIAQSFNEVLMMINVFMYCGMVLALLRNRRGPAQLPAYLFMGHILTQAQFEPDLGSYVRHFSCVLVMISPGIYYLFRNRSDAVLNAEIEVSASAQGALAVSTASTTAR